MTSPLWWENTPHDVLYAMVQQGGGREASLAAEERWAGIAQIITTAEERITRALGTSGDGWQGSAADAARRSLGTLNTWALDAVGDAQLTAGAVTAQAEHAARLRTVMPVPVSTEERLRLQVVAVEGSVESTQALVDMIERERAGAEDARRLMHDYSNHSGQNQGRLDYWTVPPAVTVDTTPIPAGPAAAGGVGGGGAPVESTTPARAVLGSAGAPAGLPPAGGDPAAGVAAAGVAAAGAAPGVGSTVAAAAPGVAPAPAGSYPGAAAGVAGLAPGAGGRGPRSPSGVASSRGPGDATGAGTRPGAGGAVGRGAGGAPGSGAGRTTRPLADRPTGPGVPGRPPGPTGAGNAARVGTGSGSAPWGAGPPNGVGGSGGSGGWRDVVARHADPADRVAARAAEPHGSPMRGGAPPVEEQARGARGSAATTGHGMYPPMGAGAGGAGQAQERSRPGYLVDDSGAFSDDRWFTEPVLTPDDPMPSRPVR